MLGCVIFGAVLVVQAQRNLGGDEAGRAPQPTGTVTGRVICSDTQRPARFAQVQLQRVQPDAAQNSGNGPGVGPGMGSGPPLLFGGGMGGRTGADGSFVLAGVSPGDYYVTATAPGYIAERLLMEAQAAAGADTADLLARLPQVHVSAGSSSSATVIIEHGAVISGRAVWEDGSPASGIQMSAILNASTALPSSASRLQTRMFQGAMTDDRGMFRLIGLPAGDYIVQGTVQAEYQGGGFSNGRRFGFPRIVQVFAPGVFRRADAKPITVRAGEERNDAHLTIDLGILRTVAGHLDSSGGAAVASGRVTLADATDRTLNLRTNIEPDGSFRIPYVPPGTYTLQVSGASSQPGLPLGGRSGAAPSGSSISFSPFSQQVVVRDADLTDLDLNLSPASSGATQ